MRYDNDWLVEQILIKGSIADGRYEAQELLDFAWEEMKSTLYAMLISAREEYLTRTVQSAIVANKQAYPITHRAHGDGLRAVDLILGDRVKNLPRIDPTDAVNLGVGEPHSFFLQGNNIMIYPTPANATGYVRQTYHIAPGRLVPVEEGAQIQTIDTVTRTITIATLPTGWSTANTFDFQKGRGGYEYLGLDYAADPVSNTMTFATALPDDLVVGDWVVLSEEAVFPQLPKAMQTQLIQQAVSAALASMGHNEAAAIAEAKSQKLAQGSMILAAPRIQGSIRRFRSTMV